MQETLVAEPSEMKRLVFGTDLETGSPATFDLEALIGSRLLISMNSGGGKSYLIRKILEASHGKVQQIVIDLEGEFATLREKFGYLLVASKGGDVRLDVRTAELLARTILENPGTSVIIDLSELKDQERKHYVRVFLDSMTNAPRELWHAVLVVVDEAHHFDPEGAEAESSPAINDLMTRGRKRGFCGVLATQRLSKLNKDAAAEANNVMIGRTTLDIDQKRASDILGFTSKEQTRSLRDLEPGQFYGFGPALAPGVNLFKGGQVSTTHPKVGTGALARLPPAASEKIKAILPKFADVTPERAEVDLKDREATRKKILDLERQLRTAQSSSPHPLDPEALRDARETGFAKGELATAQRFEPQLRAQSSVITRQKRVLEELSKKAAEAAGLPVPELPAYARPSIPSTIPRTQPIVATSQVISFEEISQGSPDGEELRLKKGALEMLRNAVRFDPGPISRDQLGALSGFSVSGGTFQDYLSQLKRRGLLEERGDGLHATEDGIELIGPVDPLPSDPQYLIEMWVPKFKAGVGKMLRILAARYPDSLSREELGNDSGYASSGGTFQDYLSQLKRNGLAVTEGDQVRASSALMEGIR